MSIVLSHANSIRSAPVTESRSLSFFPSSSFQYITPKQISASSQTSSVITSEFCHSLDNFLSPLWRVWRILTKTLWKSEKAHWGQTKSVCCFLGSALYSGSAMRLIQSAFCKKKRNGPKILDQYVQMKSYSQHAMAARRTANCCAPGETTTSGSPSLLD